jgi:hypothetical protein
VVPVCRIAKHLQVMIGGERSMLLPVLVMELRRSCFPFHSGQ